MTPPSSIVAPPHRVDARTLLRPLAACIATAGLVLVVLRLAVRGVLPTAAIAVLAPAATIALVATIFRLGVALGPLATDERGDERPIHQRHGFWVVVIGILLGLPMLGAFSLIDPWETH